MHIAALHSNTIDVVGTPVSQSVVVPTVQTDKYKRCDYVQAVFEYLRDASKQLRTQALQSNDATEEARKHVALDLTHCR